MTLLEHITRTHIIVYLVHLRQPQKAGGFFPSLSSETNLHNPLVMLAAAEAIVGLLIEISFIATFTQRFLGK